MQKEITKTTTVYEYDKEDRVSKQVVTREVYLETSLDPAQYSEGHKEVNSNDFAVETVKAVLRSNARDSDLIRANKPF